VVEKTRAAIKEVVEKTPTAIGQGSVESSAWAEGGGLHEWKGGDSRRHKVGCMLVRLRMKSTTAGVYRKIILMRINLSINIHFLIPIRILDTYWVLIGYGIQDI
jgi:hypothetical protein